MRKSREATAQSRARILNAASRMVRERGIDATSVAEVMRAAGMTNGGFYRHFQSKDEMIRLAIRAAFDDIAERFDRRLRQHGAAAAFDAYVDEYLSDRHLAYPGYGCPIAGVAADAARSCELWADEFVSGTEKLIARLAGQARGGARAAAERADVIRRLTMLVGTVVVARAVGRSDLRQEVIDACRKGVAATKSPAP